MKSVDYSFQSTEQGCTHTLLGAHTIYIYIYNTSLGEDRLQLSAGGIKTEIGHEQCLAIERGRKAKLRGSLLLIHTVREFALGISCTGQKEGVGDKYKNKCRQERKERERKKGEGMGGKILYAPCTNERRASV